MLVTALMVLHATGLDLTPWTSPLACAPCTRRTVLQRLSQIKGAPSVAFHERAPDGMQLDDIQVCAAEGVEHPA